MSARLAEILAFDPKTVLAECAPMLSPAKRDRFGKIIFPWVSAEEREENLARARANVRNHVAALIYLAEHGNKTASARAVERLKHGRKVAKKYRIME